MTYSNLQIRNRNRKLIGTYYQIYIFFLLLGRVGTGLIPEVLRRYVFNSTSAVLLYLGVILIVVSNHGCVSYPKRLRKLVYLLVYMVVANVTISLCLYRSLGTLYGETTFTAILGTTYHYIETTLAIIFNVVCLSYYVSQEKVFKAIISASAIAMVMGYIQQAVYWGIPGFSTLYSWLEKPLSLSTLEVVEKRGFACFGSEPASVSQYLLITMPTLFCCIRTKSGQYSKKICGVLFVLFLILFFTSTSSTVLILLVTFLISGLLYIIGKKHLFRIWMVIVFVFGFTYVLFYTYGKPELFSWEASRANNFLYTLIGKAFDTKNQSTAHRIGSVIVDMRIFFSEFFLTGVGAGNQGFFYEKYIPQWCLISGETRDLLNGKSGISNGGGSFFPVILSSYGLIGCAFVGAFIKKYVRALNNHVTRNQEEENWRALFLLGITNFLLDGWFTSGVVQSQPMAFLLAIPFVL